MQLPTPDADSLAALSSSILCVLMYARTFLGWFSIVIGILGTILPVLPGVPFLIIGSQLIGHRDRRLRWLRVHARLAMRRLSCSESPILRYIGRSARQARLQTARYQRRLRWKAVPQS